jgi:hypothetical protein
VTSAGPDRLLRERPDQAAAPRRVPHNAILAAILLLCAVRLWLMPLPTSFWVDETVTAFVVRQGADHPSLKAAPQVPASLYYVFPRLMDRMYGLSEVAYRVPSVLALALALFLIVRLAVRVIHPEAGWFTAFACIAFRGFNYQAADARPYALGTCVLAAGLLFLVRWLDSGRWRDAVLFVASAALLWRIHLVYWPVYAIFVGYAAVRLWRRETAVDWRLVLAAFVVIGAALVPALAEAVALNREAQAHVVVEPPSFRDLSYSLKLGFIAGCCAVASLLARWMRWPRLRWPLSPATLTLVLGWWLCQPLFLFAYSWLTGNSIFVARYLSIGLPGVGLAAAAGASLYLPSGYWRRAALVLGLGVLLFLGRWTYLFPPHHNSEWRAASARLAEASTDPRMPVLCPSPFIEAKAPAWRPDYPLPGFLYAHLSVYPVSGTPYLLPFDTSPEAERFVDDLSRNVLQRSPRFALYGSARSVLEWRQWLLIHPRLADWKNRRLGSFGDVEVIVFERPSAAP